MTTTEVKCPSCKRNLIADVFELSKKTGTPTKTGFIIYCSEKKVACDLELKEYLGTNNQVYTYFLEKKNSDKEKK